MYRELLFEYIKIDKDETRILEIACGTGNLIHLLQNDGFDVMGLDLSKEMIEQAKNKNLSVIHGDMRDFSIQDHAGLFNVIFCIFDSLNYLPTIKDIEQAFTSVYNHLLPQGLFIFDMNSDHKIKIIPSPAFKIEFRQFDSHYFIWENSGTDTTWVADMYSVHKVTRLTIYTMKNTKNKDIIWNKYLVC